MVESQIIATLTDVVRATNARLTTTGDIAPAVLDVTHDSRQVRAGWLFAAIRGASADGNDFVGRAIESGAVGVISEQTPPRDVAVAWLEVGDARAALARAAACVQSDPSAELKLAGVTGTNGKTTVAYIVRQIAEGAGVRAAQMGTVEARIGGEVFPALHTTPEASDTQRFLRQAVDAGCGVAVMECSSQALDLRRCDALSFAVAVWTNLTQDHLDYHRDMEDYYRAKRRLFDGSTGDVPRACVINTDDAYGRRLLDEVRAAGRAEEIVTCALDARADVSASEIESSLGGMRFRLHTPAGERRVASPLVGRPMLYNLLAAASAALRLGFDLETIARLLPTCAGAPGRFERVEHKGDFAVVVDYAHTPDALRGVLRTARETARGNRVIVVFGCGGDRDRAKRPLMGEAAAEEADFVILTSDNPRTEDPLRILRDTEAGLRASPTPYHVEPDRRRAIRLGVDEARAGDVVVIAGKGHETYQIIGAERQPFDDREAAREALAARGL